MEVYYVGAIKAIISCFKSILVNFRFPFKLDHIVNTMYKNFKRQVNLILCSDGDKFKFLKVIKLHFVRTKPNHGETQNNRKRNTAKFN